MVTPEQIAALRAHLLVWDTTSKATPTYVHSDGQLSLLLENLVSIIEQQNEEIDRLKTMKQDKAHQGQGS